MKHFTLLILLICLSAQTSVAQDSFFTRKNSTSTNPGNRTRAVSGVNATQASLAANAQQMQRLQVTLQSILAQMDAVASSSQQLLARIVALEAKNTQGQSEEIVALRRDLDFLKVKQGQLRSEIVKDLTNRLTKLTPRPAPAPIRPVTSSGYWHVVEARQTLSEIAAAYKKDVKTIMQANGIKDASKIQIGQRVFVPE